MDPPSARMGASLSSSEDGQRLWLFGGNTGAGSVNDLYCLELETRTWSQVPPPPCLVSPAPPLRQNLHH